MRKKRITDKISDSLDIPRDVLANMEKIVITGNGVVHIESFLGIEEYVENNISVRVKGGICRVAGESLRIDEITEDWDDEDAYAEYDLSEEEELENSFFGQRNSRYAKGNPKKFDDDDFFEEGFDDGDVLFRRDYKKAKRKQRRKKLGLFLLALVELSAIVLLILWWTSWKL